MDRRVPPPIPRQFSPLQPSRLFSSLAPDRSPTSTLGILPPSGTFLTSSAGQSGVPATLAESSATSTGAHFGPVSGGFFNSRGAVAGTFTLVAAEAILIFLTLFMCRRRYQKNQRSQARALKLGVSQDRTHRNSLPMDTFEYFDSQDSPSQTGHQHDPGKTPVSDVTDEHVLDSMENGFSAQDFTNQQWYRIWEEALHEIEHPYSTGLSPGFVANGRDQGGGLDDPMDNGVFRQTSPYDEDISTAGHSSENTRSRGHIQPPSWQSYSRASSSPSLHPSPLPVPMGGNSIRQLPTPASIDYLKKIALPLRSHDRETSPEWLSSNGTLADPGAHTMILPNPEDEGYAAVVLTRPPSNSPHPSYMSVQTTSDVRASEAE